MKQPGLRMGALLAGVAWSALAPAAWAQSASAPPPAAQAAPTSGPTSVGEIVVTAQKRSESINSIGMSIDAVTGVQLQKRGVTSTADLTKLVAGFDFTPSFTQQPVYLIRGVGLFDAGLASSPSVSVYLDQFPLLSPIMTEVAPLDLERVEVLKGPQGTLFGENSTGGAVNYIAAKPTTSYQAGLDVSYQRFDQTDVRGFVSGPVADNLTARLALGAVEGGAYQYSTTRPDDHLGNQQTYQGRLLLDWRPTDRLRFQLDVNGFHDGSDTQAAQLIRLSPANPAAVSPQFLASRPAPNNDQAADWAPGEPLRSDDSFYQLSLRTDYDITDSLVLTSLTGWQHASENKLVNNTGVAVGTDPTVTGPAANVNLAGRSVGSVNAITQEIRLSNTHGPLIWTVGANYDHQNIDNGIQYTQNGSTSQPIPTIPAYHYSEGSTDSVINDYAVFGNVDYSITPQIVAHAGLRGTISDRHADSCTFDPNTALDGSNLSDVFVALQQAFAGAGVKTTPVVPLSPSSCVSLTPAPDLSPSGVSTTLNEENLSYHLGLDYKLSAGTLFYASVNQGYKSGIITPIAASATAEYAPAKQEKLISYEIGVKTPLFGGRMHFDGAAFYYDYSDKQLIGEEIDPVFGPLEVLINVPKSRIMGLEGEFLANPIDGLNMSLGVTYLDSEVTKSFTNFNTDGAFGNFKGSELPYTPKVQVVADVQYERPISDRLEAFAGSSLTYHDASNATFSTTSAPAPDTRLNAYYLLDLRAGIEASDGSWQFTLYGKNVTNEFYVLSASKSTDEIVRYTGMPAVYGARLTLRWR
jgi:iron complex outermembrane recepter protein